MNISTTTQRNYLFDNIKALMLFLVAFGHILDVYKDSGAFELTLMKYIYLFHMPMFAFITGYFSKNLKKARQTAVEKCLIPYLLFQGVYVLMAQFMIKMGLATFKSSVFSSSILLPSSAFYYLLAVFFWKLLGKDILNLRFPLLFSVIAGILVSLTSYDDFHQGLGAVFSLLCFFVMGVLCTEKVIEKIRRIPKIWAILILLLGILPAYSLPYAIHSVRMTYSSVGFDNLTGMIYRLIFYINAVLMGAAIINLMPARKSLISQVGVASILVYGASTFLAPHGYILIANIFHLSRNRILNFVGMLVYSFLLVMLCSMPVFLKWYKAILAFICNCVFRPSNP